MDPDGLTALSDTRQKVGDIFERNLVGSLEKSILRTSRSD
jgi:hypothetical protein